MEAKHLTTKDIMNVLYGTPELVETTQKELSAIDDLTKEILPRGNDLPHSARDLSRLFEQQKELLSGRVRIWLRYRFRPQERFIRRVHQNHKEISNIYYEYFVRQGNTDLGNLMRHAPETYNRVEQHVDIARNNIEYLLGVSELVDELRQRYGSYDGYITERAFKIATLILGSILGVIGTLIAQHFTKQ